MLFHAAMPHDARRKHMLDTMPCHALSWLRFQPKMLDDIYGRHAHALRECLRRLHVALRVLRDYVCWSPAMMFIRAAAHAFTRNMLIC